MATSKRESLKSDIRRIQIERLLRDGKSISAAAKQVGTSYANAKRIAEQMDES